MQQTQQTQQTQLIQQMQKVKRQFKQTQTIILIIGDIVLNLIVRNKTLLPTLIIIGQKIQFNEQTNQIIKKIMPIILSQLN